MANIAFRDSSIVLIETGRSFIKAGLGVHDLLRAPSVEIQARVGIRPPPDFSSYTRANSTLDALPSASTSRAASALPQPHPLPSARVTDYLVGTQLDDALAAGHDLVVSWPFADGKVHDWVQAEALWKHVLFTGLGLRRAQNESPVLLTFFPGLPRDTYERAAQLFFERLNVAAFSILERPAAQLYAANTLTGVVVDIGTAHTDIALLSDGLPLHGGRTTVPVGTAHCERHLAHLLRGNTSVMGVLGSLDPAALDEALLALAKQTWTTGLVRAPGANDSPLDADDEGVTDIAAVVVAGKEKAVIESGMKKRATAKASAAEQARAREIEALDLTTVHFRGAEITLGRERHRFIEPLFDAGVLHAMWAREGGAGKELGDDVGLVMPLQNAVGHAVGRVEVDQRQYIYNGLFVTGEIASLVKGIGAFLQQRLGPFVVTHEPHHQNNDVQPRHVRLVKVPEYFAEFRDRGDGLAAFLGSSIVAKISFHDGKHFVSKAEYTERGPKAVLEMSPSLL
ncbi:actin-like ATPase domain-containing protein [Amylostereum chailletii]|nr:actin-like ATPase domain-containing protein [Amylostereum chailletii]